MSNFVSGFKNCSQIKIAPLGIGISCRVRHGCIFPISHLQVFVSKCPKFQHRFHSIINNTRMCFLSHQVCQDETKSLLFTFKIQIQDLKKRNFFRKIMTKTEPLHSFNFIGSLVFSCWAVLTNCVHK